MIWVLAALAFCIPFVWRYVVVTGSVAVAALLVVGGVVWCGSVAFVFVSMLL